VAIVTIVELEKEIRELAKSVEIDVEHICNLINDKAE
jgi:plasmid maintenance system antidote protein VapI